MSKIALVANTDWYLYNFRFALAEHLRRQGHAVLLISPSGQFVEAIRGMGFDWREWEVGRKTFSPWTELWAIFQLVRIYHQEHPDLVHHFTIKPVLYGSLSARVSGVTAVVNTITGLGYVFLSKGWKAGLLQKTVKQIYRFVLKSPKSMAVFENATDQQYFIQQKLVSAEKTCLIEGVGVDPELFSPAPEVEGTPLVVLPARMLWDKGVGVLIEAARLLGQRVKVRIALVGEPDPGNPTSIPESTLRSWEQEGLVEWWGWRQDMREVYQRSHIVTLPSFREGAPTVLLEAAASARPIVTTDAPGCRDVVKDGINGLIVPINDPSALAKALEKLVLSPELRRHMGQTGRQMVMERFTQSLVNEAYDRIYADFL